MWLTYDEYTAMGGTADIHKFESLEMKARKRIDYRTLERIRDPDEDIKKLVFELVEMQRGFGSHDNSVSSYGNDGVSVSYVSPEVLKKDFEAKADTLIDAVAGDFAYRGL